MGLEEIRNIKKVARKKVRTKQINDKSDKRKTEEKQYIKIKAEVLKKHPFCQWPGCPKKSVDVHHASGRVGKNYTDKKKMKALCRKHHIFAELNPNLAKTLKINHSRLNKMG